MTDKFAGKYRIPTARATWWNYGNDAAYFVTICTAHREHFFGEIVTPSATTIPQMELNAIGRLAHQYWLEIPNHFPFVKLGAFTVMPNHVHGILVIDKSDIVETLQCNVSTGNRENEKFATISPKQGSLASAVRSYKSIVSREAHSIHADFGWQSRFHDHIIRNDDEYRRIADYIENNPAKWAQDKFFG